MIVFSSRALPVVGGAQVKLATPSHQPRSAAQVAARQGGDNESQEQPLEVIHDADANQPTAPRRRSLMAEMFDQMQQEMEEMQDLMGMPGMLRRGSFGLTDPFQMGRVLQPISTRMQLDMRANDSEYEITADLPGVPKDQIKVRLGKDNILEISAERSSEQSQTKGNAVIQERSYGTFQRRIRLPEGIDATGIQAKCDDGVLKITVPKTEAEEDQSMVIDVE